ncbi:hypothetical protein BG006_001369, partial [Podila minutissima]
MTSYRVVHMLYQTDADLFDAIQEWKETHPDLWVDDAIDAFDSAKGADALAHLVYSTEAFDIILKYSASHADLCSIFDQQPKNDRSHRDTNGDIAISSPTLTSPVSKQSFQPLQPLDCSTDLFPSPQSSTVVLDSQQHTTSIPTLPSSDITVPQTSGREISESTQRPPHHHHNNRSRRRGSKPSKAKLREWKIQLHRRDYQLALLKQGVFIELEKSIDSEAVYVKVLAPFWRLEDEAQKTSCKADLANSILPSIPYASRIFPSITKLFPCLKQPGLEQRREAMLFKTARLNDYHLAEPGRKWSDVVRHAGA